MRHPARAAASTAITLASPVAAVTAPLDDVFFAFVTGSFDLKHDMSPRTYVT